MISPFTLYVILLLDNVKDSLSDFFFMALTSILVTGIVAGLSEGEAITYSFFKRWFKWALSIAVVCGVLNTILPTTKQAAAIFVIPAIANNETVQKEAGELYDLAKQGLKTLVAPQQPPAPAK